VAARQRATRAQPSDGRRDRGSRRNTRGQHALPGPGRPTLPDDRGPADLGRRQGDNRPDHARPRRDGRAGQAGHRSPRSTSRLAGPPNSEPYTYAGIDRRKPLLWLAVAVAALVALITRVRGVLAIVGLGLSLLLVTRFLVPALLIGRPALPVAIVGSLAVMFVTVVLTYGLSPPSLAACLGIGTCLLFAAVVDMVAADAAHLDGRSSELATFLAGTDRAISLQGVVLAGLVIGALGVLADYGDPPSPGYSTMKRFEP
jgi:hypothetical protein